MLKTWSNDNWKNFLVFHKLLEILRIFVLLYCSLWNKTKTYEFLWQSVEPQETIPLSAFQQKHRPRQPTLFSPPKFVPSLGSPNPELVRYSIQGGYFLSSMGKTLWYLKKFLSVFTNVHSIRIFTTIIIQLFNAVDIHIQRVNISFTG